MPIGCHMETRAGLSQVALAANHRPAFFPGISPFFVTGNTIGMVNIHHFLFGGILKPHKFGDQAIIFNQMTGGAVLVFCCQRFSVLLVKKCHRRPFQLAKGLHGINANDVCPFFSRGFRWVSWPRKFRYRSGKLKRVKTISMIPVQLSRAFPLLHILLPCLACMQQLFKYGFLYYFTGS